MIMPGEEILVHERKDAFHFQRDGFNDSAKNTFRPGDCDRIGSIEQFPGFVSRTSESFFAHVEDIFSAFCYQAPNACFPSHKDRLVIDELASDRWFDLLKEADFRFLVREAPGKNYPP